MRGSAELVRNNQLLSEFCNESRLPYSLLVSSFRNTPTILAHALEDVPVVVLARSLLCRAMLVGEHSSENDQADTAVFETHSVPVIGADAAEYLKGFGNASFKSKRYAEAVQFYKGAAMFQPRSGKIFSNLAAAWRCLGCMTQAIEAAQHCCRIDSAWYKGSVQLALALVDTGDLEGALNAARRAAELEPSDKQVVRLLDKLCA